jgi:lipid II:glycine glycyltransferase (peptidoglycan interpeptide bridge formation enzyme)
MSQSEFLQSEAWARLQAAAGHEVVRIGDDHAYIAMQNMAGMAYGFVHALPLVGKYLYTPRWPGKGILNLESRILELTETAKMSGCKWVRVEPETEEVLEVVRNEIETLRSSTDSERPEGLEGRQAQGDNVSIVVAPHDMQPRETFVIDISKSEEELLAAMKPKTRYNIRLAEKKGVKVFATRENKYQAAFLDLIAATAERKDIVPHPRSYYEKFFTELPEDMLYFFVAEYEGAVIAANLVMVCGDTATYLHGGSGDKYRDVMAPFLLQWEQIKFAKTKGCTRYDFGGVKTVNGQQLTVNGEIQNPCLAGRQAKSKIDSWSGITRFKTGFSPQTAPTVFPGCYDIVLDKCGYRRYAQLRFVQKVLSSTKKLFHI